ncbi:hypothetical protein LSH36_146g01060 [Paralvinella palmiformis]|uniref:Hsp90 chaperone protein kinase-targeting subunit n=1 Tax=Paralvinella palmiformis TaxID=53620 RepID=A0AAD9JV53_9ANNE|nr:hypothetical protein LSH36_146g01060 [Paralvinella palmiformis]
MARPIDYSVWDHIEISDDEDDTHPNIDTPSLFRWRHQARVDRMEQNKKAKEEFQKEYSGYQQKANEVKRKLKEAEEKAAVEELSKLKLELSDIEKQEIEWKKKEEELNMKEKSTPWNVDTLSKDGKCKTIINKIEPAQKQQLTDEEKAQRQVAFSEKYEAEIKKFGMLHKYDDSQQYLVDHPHLVCEEAANFLVLWCVNLEVEEKHDLMEHVSHQTIVMQFILELAKSLDVDPRGCIRGFFSKIKLAEKQYMDAFNDELEAFKERVRSRAKVRIEEAIKKIEEEERQKRLGPGGLDPVEVFETLPKCLQDCFESKDLELLKKIISDMPKEEAEYHMKRCVDSGLWVPDAKKAEGQSNDGGSESDEEVYEEAPLPEK